MLPMIFTLWHDTNSQGATFFQVRVQNVVIAHTTPGKNDELPHLEGVHSAFLTLQQINLRYSGFSTLINGIFSRSSRVTFINLNMPTSAQAAAPGGLKRSMAPTRWNKGEDFATPTNTECGKRCLLFPVCLTFGSRRKMSQHSDGELGIKNAQQIFKKSRNSI